MTFLENKTKAFFFIFVALLSCGGAPVDQLELPKEDYEVRFDITDPQIVGIVESKESRDTLMLVDLEQRLNRLRELAPDVMNDPAQSRKMKKEILDNFLQTHVLQLESSYRNIEVDEELLKSEISAFKNRFGDDDSYRQELNSMGLSEEGFALDTENRIKQRFLMEGFRDEVEEPSQADLDAFIVEQQESRRLAHILFSFDRASNSEELASLKELALSVRDSLQNGADFSRLAIQHSDDGSSRSGGDLGFVERGQMVGGFEEAAFNLQNNGDITKDLVATVFGLHIIKLLSVKTNPPLDRKVANERLFNNQRHDAVNEQIRLLKSNALLRLNSTHLSQDLYK